MLETLVAPLGRASGFVQRSSKLTGVRFVQLLVLACLGRVDVTLRQMVVVGAELGVELSVAGLNQRLTQPAVRLLAQVLQAALTQTHTLAGEGCALFAHFSAVHIQDSTSLSLPQPMAAAWRGAGGNASSAGAKVLLAYEYLSGRFSALSVLAGVVPDQACRLAPALAQPGSLHLFDLGFFSQYLLAELQALGSFFVCRLQYQTALYTSAGERIELEAFLAGSAQHQLDVTVLLGATVKLPVRLLCQRVPQAVADQRRAKAKAVARRRGRTLAPATLRLMDWNLFCTNVPGEWWRLEQVLAVYRLRWQIELLFKLFKSQAGLEAIGEWRQERVLVQLYARLLGLVLVQQLLAPLRFARVRELSLPKAFAIVQQSFVPKLIACAAHGWRGLAHAIETLANRCLRLALKERRTKDPSTYDFLLALGV
jgi:hypothetical protein